MKTLNSSTILILSILAITSVIVPTVISSVFVPTDSHSNTQMMAQELMDTQFYENNGQFPDESVKYYGNIPGGYIGFAQNGILLWSADDPSSVRLSFIDATGEVDPTAIDQVTYRINFFLGDRGTFAGVRGFENIVYTNLWNQIDLTFDARANGVEYEFLVHSGGNPAQIALMFEGQDSITVEDNSISVQRETSGFVFEGLVVNQGETMISGQFTEIEHDTFGFEIGSYDKSETLVIDPLIYSTFIGGEGSDSGMSIAIDSVGNSYVCGRTTSLDFPVVGAYDDSFNGIPSYYNYDCFILKMNAEGDSLIYSTFIGGQGYESARSIAIDTSGSAYVCGYTDSSDFPTVNGYDDTTNDTDCFILKLNAVGNSVIYSTLVGGIGEDEGRSLAIDSVGNVYACGTTESTDFPTINAIDDTNNGTDCFLLKLNSDGNTLLYSTLIGGTGRDTSSELAVDSNGNVYLCGGTNSSDFPITNAYDATHNGQVDAFILKLNATGESLIYSTFVGGEFDEWANSMTIDSSGNAYVCGTTDSPDFPTINAYDDSHSSSAGDARYDIFILKLNSTGNTLVYSTFVGGNSQDFASSIAIDSSGCAYVCGATASNDFPIVNGFDYAYNGSLRIQRDCFILKVNAEGNSVLYSSIVGTANKTWGESWGYSLAIDNNGTAYVCGETSFSDFPTINAYDDTFNGDSNYYGGDCIILKITPGAPLGSAIQLIVIFVGSAILGVAIVVVLIVIRKQRS